MLSGRCSGTQRLPGRRLRRGWRRGGRCPRPLKLLAGRRLGGCRRRRVRRRTGRGLRLRGWYVRRLTGRRLRGGGRRRAGVRLWLRSRLCSRRPRPARRCVDGRRMLLARRPWSRRSALTGALAGRPPISFVWLGRSALREANAVFYWLGKCRLRARGGKNHCGTKQQGITCHWFLALLGDRNPLIATWRGFYIEPRRSVEVDDFAPPRLDAPAVRLQTITTRQNCGENPQCRYVDKACGRFVPGQIALFHARVSPLEAAFSRVAFDRRLCG